MNSYVIVWIHIIREIYEFIFHRLHMNSYVSCYEFIYPLSIIWIHIIRQLYEFILFVHTSYQFVYSSQSQLHRQLYKWNRFFLKIALWPLSTFYCTSLLTWILGLLNLWLFTLSWKCRQHAVTCRHDMTCCSNFGQMGPCCRHNIEDIVAVCVGLSQHLPDFPKCVCRNILWYGSTYAQILSHPHAKGGGWHICHLLVFW